MSPADREYLPAFSIAGMQFLVSAGLSWLAFADPHVSAALFEVTFFLDSVVPRLATFAPLMRLELWIKIHSVQVICGVGHVIFTVVIWLWLRRWLRRPFNDALSDNKALIGFALFVWFFMLQSFVFGGGNPNRAGSSAYKLAQGDLYQIFKFALLFPMTTLLLGAMPVVAKSIRATA